MEVELGGEQHRDRRNLPEQRKSLKRKLEVDLDELEEASAPLPTGDAQRKVITSDVLTQVNILNNSFSWKEFDRSAAKRAAHVLAELAKNEDVVNLIVGGGAVPALVKHLQAPPSTVESERGVKPFEHEVEKGSSFALGLLAVKPEHQQFIVDTGALSHLVALLKRHKDGTVSRAVTSVIRRAADAITNLAHENSCIKTSVRMEGGIPPLVELLEFTDTKVQRAAAGALRTLAFKNDENKNQIVECNALPTLILMLRSEDAAIHYEAVGVIGNLVHSSPNIKKDVLLAGALQPVIATKLARSPLTLIEATCVLEKYFPHSFFDKSYAPSKERLALLRSEQGESLVSLDKDPLSQVHGIEDNPRGIGSKASRTRALMVEQMLEIRNMNKRKKRIKNKNKNKKNLEKRLEKIEAALFTTSSSKVPSSSVDTNHNGNEKSSSIPSHTPTHATLSGNPSSHTSSQRNFKIRSTSDYGKIVGQGRGSIEPTPGVIVHHRPMLAIERKISLNLVHEGMENEHLYLDRQGCATTLGEMEGGFLVWPMYLLEEIQD